MISTYGQKINFSPATKGKSKFQARSVGLLPPLASHAPLKGCMGCTAGGSMATPGQRRGGHRTPIPSNPHPNEPYHIITPIGL
ncbi:hypothetical protein COCOBI_pt-1630 (chloroplast) [Coccomyxa sp. Obi]|nr:hypothetical protein COCOBI_pt-1630 [Coccomyxa sp. Obi]